MYTYDRRRTPSEYMLYVASEEAWRVINGLESIKNWTGHERTHR